MEPGSDEAYRDRLNPELVYRFNTGQLGPWLAGMTLDPSSVYEAWCHQRGNVCMIEEFGGRPVKAGESFSAAFIVGCFDSISEMHEVYDAHTGFSDLKVSEKSWELTH